jgi:trans-2-enoyl-CoA reductase
MFSRSVLQATRGIRPARAGQLTQAPLVGRRYISVYGYTQAKALIYSKYGEPKDVLRYEPTPPQIPN